jgi:hypothetical protein
MAESKPAKYDKTLKGSSLTRFVDGAISGFVSGAALQPLQVIKTSMQVSPIEKTTDHKMSKTFQKVLSHSKH